MASLTTRHHAIAATLHVPLKLDDALNNTFTTTLRLDIATILHLAVAAVVAVAAALASITAS